MPATACGSPTREVVYMARAARGRANIMMGKNPVMKGSPRGSPAAK
jgi:hypothetical protein